MTVSARAGDATPAEVPRPDGKDRLLVLETKLVPPYPRRGLVVRHGILGGLVDVEAPVLTVIAPAGYGKSTLLGQWADQQRRPIAWLSADERDSDAATLLRGIAAALDRATGLDASVIDAVAIPGPSVWSMAVPRIGAAIAASRPFTLVVDDVDRIGGDEALDVLVTLIGYLGRGSKLGVAGRGNGAFPVARLVSRGQVTALDRQALALDIGEAHAVIGATGAAMTTDEVAALHERTEGWPAGIYLSALAARGRRDAAIGPRPTADANDRLIEDYLRSEVLASTGPDDVDLLLRASVLDRVSGPLCDEILERTGSGMALDRLERSNLFLIPLDRDRTWFRFHHLLADLLRAELSRRDPEAARQVRRRAAAWHEEHGLLEPALEYALAAEDADRAARLLSRLSQATVNAGRNDTVRRWFGWFERRALWKAYPRLAAVATTVFALDGDAARSDRWWIEGGLDDPDAPGSAMPIAAYTRAFRCQEGVERMHADAELALRTMEPDEPFRIAAMGILGIAALLRGDAVAAEASMLDGVAHWERGSTANYAAVLCLTHLAGIAIDRGDWTLAGAQTKRARSIAIAHGLDEQAAAAAVDAVNARIALHHGAIEQARADANHARRLRTLFSSAAPWIAIRVRLDLIRVDLGLGDGGGARTLLAEVREILRRNPDMGSLVDETADLERRVALLRGAVAGATTLTLAELRLLPLLTTHLSFREIGERLYVTQNTVKTQAISIYRKLDATSRSEAVAQATAMGLLDGTADEGSTPTV